MKGRCPAPAGCHVWQSRIGYYMRMSLQRYDLSTVRRRLAQSGYRLTPQRWTVWTALRQLGGHPSAEGLYRQVRRTHPMVSRATVYRTLEVLAGVGLVTPLPTLDGITRFDPGPPHVNMQCVRCGRIEDAPDPHVLACVVRLALRRGFQADRGVVVQGTCARCRAEPKSRRPRRLNGKKPQERRTQDG